MIETLFAFCVFLLIVFLIGCVIARAEFVVLCDRLDRANDRGGELSERCGEWSRMNRNLQAEIVKKEQRIAELEAEVARLDGFYDAVVAASETLVGDEE